MEGSPRLAESSPKFSDTSTPRFTENFGASPPYQYFHSPENGTQNSMYSVEISGGTTTHNGFDKKRSQSPAEFGSPLPESVQNDYHEKEVAFHPPQPDYHTSPEQHSRDPQRKRFGMTRKVCVLASILAVIIVALAVGLGAGLGVGLKKHHSSSSTAPSPQDQQYLIGGAISPQYYSTSGAFNGSGIALASESFATKLQSGTDGSLVMYFQHWTGEIRYEQLSNTGAWLGGDISSVVANDAKNSTPLSAVSYAVNDTSTWHVFYVNTENQLRQKTNSNVTNIWVDGPISAMNLTVFDADEVGMQACWYGNDYGDTNYAHTPLPGNQSANYTNTVGMHMWYASDNTTFQQYGWRYGEDTWTYQQAWPDKNGHAGVGCYSWGPGTVTYVMFVNLESTVEFWWKDTNTNLTNSTSHPTDIWVNSSMAINDVYPSSSLGYTNYFYAQDQMFNINGYNITWAAENSTISAPFLVQGDTGLPGTHMSVTALPNQSGGNNILVFYQTNGTDISEYTRDLVAGQWTSVNIPIPQS